MILAVPVVAVVKTIFTYFNDKYEFISLNAQIDEEVENMEEL